MSTRFLNSEKIEYWFFINRFLIKKKCVMEQPSGLDSLYGILGGEGVREVFCVGGGGQNSGGSGGFLTAGDHTQTPTSKPGL